MTRGSAIIRSARRTSHSRDDFKCPACGGSAIESEEVLIYRGTSLGTFHAHRCPRCGEIIYPNEAWVAVKNFHRKLEKIKSVSTSSVIGTLATFHEGLLYSNAPGTEVAPCDLTLNQIQSIMASTPTDKARSLVRDLEVSTI